MFNPFYQKKINPSIIFIEKLKIYSLVLILFCFQQLLLAENKPSNLLINDTTKQQITIKLIETAGTNLVKYIGWSRGEDFDDGKLKSPQLFKKDPNGNFFRLDSFVVKKNSTISRIDYLVLFDAKKDLLGHIPYEYYPEKEANFIRQVIVILHNSQFDCQEGTQKHFPYSKESPYWAGLFGGKWTYFNKGEYPVTMLIPPDYYDHTNNSIGNKFPEKLNKKPVLFVHGLTGKYNNYSKAKPENNETSYWWMQVKHFNKSKVYEGWQVYYPYDANIDFIARWLKFDVELLNKLYKKEVDILTHSMGGLVAMELITSPYFDAKKNIGKVLLIQPPIHGSLGGNKQYRTGKGRVFQLLGFDREAPSIRDLSFGSDFYYNLHNRKIPSLDDDKFISDDYFVLIGTTQEKYKLPKLVHNEAEGQSDGIVAMSSASLMDYKIRYALINANHDDGRGCWSKFDFEQDNEFLADFAQAYFNKNVQNFEYYLAKNRLIDGYVQMKTNQLYLKKEREDVNLKQGAFTIRIKKNTKYDWKKELGEWDELIVLKNKTKKALLLSPRISSAKGKEKFAEANGLEDVEKLYPEIDGYMNRNPFTSEDYLTYYYTKKPAQIEQCVSDMAEGTYKVYLYLPEKKFSIYLGSFKFNHMQTALVEFDISKKDSPFFEMEGVNTFTNYILAAKERKDPSFSPDTIVTINEGTTRAIFQVACADAFKRNIAVYMNLKNPNGVLINSKISSVKWKLDEPTGTAYYIIDKPTPGDWKVAIRTAKRSSKRMYYITRVFQDTRMKRNGNKKEDNKSNNKTTKVLKSIFSNKE
jgi:pimeloyl-ACP methyl ester carboxylesterase